MSLIRRANIDRGQRAVAAIPQEKLQELLQTTWGVHGEILFEQNALRFWPRQDELDMDALDTWARRRGWGLVARYRNGAMLLAPLYGQQVPKPPWATHYYHVADVQDVASILRRGLLPRTRDDGSCRYPQRVYLADSLHMAMVVREQALRNFAGGRGMTKTPHVCVLEIDLSRLRRGTRFYRDPEFGFEHSPGLWLGGLFTPTHIPPEAIKRVDERSAEGPFWDSAAVVVASDLTARKYGPLAKRNADYKRAVRNLVTSSTLRFKEVEALLLRELCADSMASKHWSRQCATWHAAQVG
jgi:hypothetical protein